MHQQHPRLTGATLTPAVCFFGSFKISRSHKICQSFFQPAINSNVPFRSTFCSFDNNDDRNIWNSVMHVTATRVTDRSRDKSDLARRSNVVSRYALAFAAKFVTIQGTRRAEQSQESRSRGHCQMSTRGQVYSTSHWIIDLNQQKHVWQCIAFDASYDVKDSRRWQ